MGEMAGVEWRILLKQMILSLLQTGISDIPALILIEIYM